MTGSRTRRIAAIVVAALVIVSGLALVAGSISTSSRDAAAKGYVEYAPVGVTDSSGKGRSTSQFQSQDADAESSSRGLANAPDTGTGDVLNAKSADRIIRTADLSVQVRRGGFDAAWNAAFDISKRFGGRVMTSTRGAGGGPIPLPYAESDAAGSKDGRDAFGTITIRVPAADFEATTKALRGLGEVRADTSSSEDVSLEYVDLKARLRNMRAERDALLVMFDRAKTIKDTLLVQTRLSEVQGQIEEATGRQNFLDERTEFSTISVTIAEPGAAFSSTPFDDGPSFAHAWETAKVGLVRMGTGAMIAGVWLAPFALVLLIGLAIRRRTRRPTGGDVVAETHT